MYKSNWAGWMTNQIMDFYNTDVDIVYITFTGVCKEHPLNSTSYSAEWGL